MTNDSLIASQDGLPRAIENGATVDDVFTVGQVDTRLRTYYL
ncbi:hypothetical protein [Alishewanella longhuensis]